MTHKNLIVISRYIYSFYEQIPFHKFTDVKYIILCVAMWYFIVFFIFWIGCFTALTIIGQICAKFEEVFLKCSWCPDACNLLRNM